MNKEILVQSAVSGGCSAGSDILEHIDLTGVIGPRSYGLT